MKDKGPKALNTSSPILDHFVWHRLVVDEGHEVLKDVLTMRMLWETKAHSKWYVSGTPFPSEYALLSSFCYQSYSLKSSKLQLFDSFIALL